MNPWDLDATGLMTWGLVAHLVGDWVLQNDWMARNKARRAERRPYPSYQQNPRPGAPVRRPPERWWLRHPAAYVHAGIHGALLALVFGWPAAILALAHLVIDCRWPVVKWSELVRQTQPGEPAFLRRVRALPSTRRRIPERVDKRVYERSAVELHAEPPGAVAVDIGLLVRFECDQVFHIVCVAAAALVVA